MAKYNDTVCGGRGDAAASRRTARQSRHAVDGNELLVQDGLFVLPCAPQAMAVTRHLVWIALAADTSSQREKAGAGGVQVHNAYTGAIVCSLTVTAVATTTTTTAMQLPAPARALCATTSHKDVPHVWVGLANGVVHVRHALTAALHAILHAHDASVTSMTEFAGLVYTASADARIVQWHSASCTVVRVFVATATHTHVPRTRVQQHEQLLSQLLHTTREGTSQTTTTTTTAQRTRTAAAVRCLYAEGGALVSGGEDGVVRVWDVGAGAVQLSAQLHKGHGVTALCRVGVTMWSGDAAGCVVVWRLRTCEVLRSATLHTCRITTLQKVGARVYSGAADGVVCICDAHSGDVLQRVAAHRDGYVAAMQCVLEVDRYYVWAAAAATTATAASSRNNNNSNNISNSNSNSAAAAAMTTTGAEVRCWHHDEQVCMTALRERYNDMCWYYTHATSSAAGAAHGVADAQPHRERVERAVAQQCALDELALFTCDDEALVQRLLLERAAATRYVAPYDGGTVANAHGADNDKGSNSSSSAAPLSSAAAYWLANRRLREAHRRRTAAEAMWQRSIAAVEAKRAALSALQAKLHKVEEVLQSVRAQQPQPPPPPSSSSALQPYTSVTPASLTTVTPLPPVAPSTTTTTAAAGATRTLSLSSSSAPAATTAATVTTQPIVTTSMSYEPLRAAVPPPPPPAAVVPPPPATATTASAATAAASSNNTTTGTMTTTTAAAAPATASPASVGLRLTPLPRVSVPLPSSSLPAAASSSSGGGGVRTTDTLPTASPSTTTYASQRRLSL